MSRRRRKIAYRRAVWHMILETLSRRPLINHSLFDVHGPPPVITFRRFKKISSPMTEGTVPEPETLDIAALNGGPSWES